ncbi:M50 family metallopeptidase [Nocardioides sp.]|uniref:M50 family metallopeptidase n=1 Tax=Nocardioides sp. TaxID=35761 RepID=UPI0027353CCF|nr:M50 family metallopeptidase [Nocardioides sp.]MDP3892100.1 M50 family metallopeptidase [Nocardioides sp.]
MPLDGLLTLWRRATAVQPVPEPGVVLLLGLVALTLVVAPATWRHVRLPVTMVHEAGHAVAAVLVGRRLTGIRLHSDTSGLTVSRGRPRGPGMVLMLAAGYLAPALVGLGAALLLAAGRSLGVLWLFVVLLALMLLHVRNGYGLLVLLLAVGAMSAVSWYLEPTAQSWIAYLIVWILLLAAPKPVLELFAGRRRGARGSDPDQLARLTRVPAVLWMVLFLLANLAGLMVGTLTLLPVLA